MKKNVIIIGAAGRDFHNFNCVFRDDAAVTVAAFTATQIPDIAGRRYPPDLAGKLYPEGIPIIAESGLEELFSQQKIDEAVFSYSDVSHQHVMEQASRVIALGAESYTALQVMQIVGDQKVRVVHDVAVSGTGSSTRGGYSPPRRRRRSPSRYSGVGRRR